jgi:hypothetical protein
MECISPLHFQKNLTSKVVDNAARIASRQTRPAKEGAEEEQQPRVPFKFGPIKLTRHMSGFASESCAPQIN